MRTRLDLANERYRRLLENMTDVVYELDHQGRFVYVSASVEALLGYSSDELVGTHHSRLIHSEDITTANQRFNERRTGAGGTRNLELRLLHKDNRDGAAKVIHVEVNAVGLHGPHQHFLGTVGVVQTLVKCKQDQARLQETGNQLRHAERVAELGQFIAEIAHELNTPLTSICGYTDLMLGQISDSRLMTQLKTVAAQAARAAQIVKELLLFSQPQPVERIPVSISQVVDRVLALKAQELTTHAIQTEVRLAKQTPPVLCDESHLRQILLNLITNAEHAMWEKDRGGRLIIASQAGHPTDDRRWVDLEIIDSGPGKPSEDRPRIFTPFFTKTKGGSSTGLGLAVVDRLIQENGGAIEVDSAPGGGACFRLRLQTANFASRPESPPRQAPSTPVRTSTLIVEKEPSSQPPTTGFEGNPWTPHIIVVENERSIRYLISTVLAQEGYRVSVCENGRQGLQQVRQALNLRQATGGNQDPAVILSDFQVPGMNGREFFAELKRVSPDLIRRLCLLPATP